MSDTNPMAALFEAQRESIRNGQSAMKRSAEIQRRTLDAYTGSLEAQKSAQQRSVAVSHGMIEAYLDGVHSMTPGDTAWVDDIRTVVEESYDAFNQMHEESWIAYEELVEENVEAIDDLSEESLALLDDSIAAVLEAHSQMESQAHSATDAVDIQVE